jgi:hypothetical protein
VCALRKRFEAEKFGRKEKKDRVQKIEEILIPATRHEAAQFVRDSFLV